MLKLAFLTATHCSNAETNILEHSLVPSMFKQTFLTINEFTPAKTYVFDHNTVMLEISFLTNMPKPTSYYIHAKTNILRLCKDQHFTMKHSSDAKCLLSRHLAAM
jgi:hypothetical protein